MYILTYQNLLHVYTNLISVRYRNVTPRQLYFHVPFPVLILLYILFLYITNPRIHCYIITLYNFMFCKEVERVNENKYVFIVFVMSIFFQFLVLLFVLIYLNYHLILFLYQYNFSPTHFLCAIILKDITSFYAIGPTIQLYMSFIITFLTLSFHTE